MMEIGLEETDEALLVRFAAGQADAMGRLVERHGSSVYAFVRRFLGASALADDVYQEVWLRVIRYADKFEGRSRFTTWLFQITRNVCMDQRRAKQRKPDGLPLEDGSDAPVRDRVADPAANTAEQAAEREERHAVETALAGLPEEQREVFLLREKTEMTFEEIASLTGLSPNTVKSRMRYALVNLRKALKGIVAHGH
jgi:RNA polymerase sigma-70 factor (ECF subfamily)